MTKRKTTANRRGHSKHERSRAGQIVFKTVQDNPTVPSWALAKAVVRDNPGLFSSVDIARMSVRYYRGRMGKQSRKNASVEVKGTWDTLLGELPPAIEHNLMEPFPIREQHGYVLADVHVPYHSVVALKAALNHMKQKGGVDFILLNGDIWDAYSLSRFTQAPEERDLCAEATLARQFLETLRKMWPKARLIWKIGNHEARLRNHLAEQAPDLVRYWHKTREKELCPDSLTHFLELDELGIEIVDHKKPIEFGKLSILHGDELGMGGYDAVSPARTAFLRCNAQVLVAHSHRASSYSARTLDNTVISAWSMGCLCELSPYYRPINTWSWGVGELELDPADGFHFFNNKILPNGKLYPA